FFQAEDGIRDLTVTGVQTCALPIYHRRRKRRHLAAAVRADLPCPSSWPRPLRRHLCRPGPLQTPAVLRLPADLPGHPPLARPARSEERRVGKEWRLTRAPRH